MFNVVLLFSETFFGLSLRVHKFLDHGFLFLGSFEIIGPSNFLLFNGYLSFGTSYFKGYIIRARWRWKQDLCTCRHSKGPTFSQSTTFLSFYGITHEDFTEQKSTLSCGVAIHAYTVTNMWRQRLHNVVQIVEFFIVGDNTYECP